MFITKDDIWGIRQAVRKIWISKNHKHYGLLDEEFELLFDAFFNQIVPKSYRESKETVIRHRSEIEALANIRPSIIWIKRGGIYKSTELTWNVLTMIKTNQVELPAYLEVEEEKQRWQQGPRYRKDEGVSQPIRDEFIQLRVVKRGGV